MTSRIGYEQHLIRVVIREAAVLCVLLLAPRIGDADIWGHDDIRGTWVKVGTQAEGVVIDGQ